MEFRSLVEICEKIEKITKRNVMIAFGSDFLRGLVRMKSSQLSRWCSVGLSQNKI